jgi:hypothetical protein
VAPVPLHLDFDGHFESTWGSYSNVTAPLFDTDGDSTTYSDAELQAIYTAWSKAAEDYAPFNVDVTTVEPPELAPGMPASAADGKAIRVAIGGNGSWYGAGSGVAYIGSFTNSIPNVAWVFSDVFNPNWLYWIGDGVSHEAGHAFGLGHQRSFDVNGVKTDEYNHGNATWAPIMGYFYRSVSTVDQVLSAGTLNRSRRLLHATANDGVLDDVFALT